MNIKKQHIVLNLIASGRYSLNDQTGEIISHIGKEPRVLQPIAHYNGYKQYNLDVGYNERIMIYGQGFSYLYKWRTTFDPAFVIDHIDGDKSNNKPDNLRCITQKDNNNASGNRLGSKIKRVRLPIDVKTAIIQAHKDGVSFVKLAAKYGTTRQTIARLCNVT